MYSLEQRKLAVETLIKFDHSYADTIAELGYPNRHSLYNWWKDYQEYGEVRPGKPIRQPKFTPEMKQAAVEHYLEHGKSLARTMRALGYPKSKEYLASWIDELAPGQGIRGVAPNSRKRATVPDPGAPPRPDLVRRNFEPPVPTTVLCGDITYLKTGQGWLYLATVIDLCTRMVVGWSLSERMTADIAVSALDMARSRGYVAGGAIFHSDRGAQHTSRLLGEWASANDVRLSVGRTGSCHDNAVSESFFATLKNEMYSLRSWPTRAQARSAVVGYIEGYYNRARPHSTIGYQTPAGKMGAFFERTAPKREGVPLAA